MELTGKKYRAKAWYKDEFAYYVIEFLSNEQALINHRLEDDTNITDRSLVDCQLRGENQIMVMIDNKAYEGTINDDLLTFAGLPRNYYLY